MEFEKRLKKWIKKWRLTNTEAAFMLGIAYPTIVGFLNGKRPGDRTLTKLYNRMDDYDLKHSETITVPKPAAA